MPVVVKPQPEIVGTNTDVAFTSSREILSAASTAWKNSKDGESEGYFEQHPQYGVQMAQLWQQPVVTETRPIVSSSFNDEDTVVVYGGGFVHCVMRAFQQDLHLVIRPDDLWQAILTQLSFFVVGHAEELRHLFVAHEGKTEVVLDITPHSFNDLPPGLFARLFVDRMQEQLVDKELAEWFLPKFTTTTSNDTATASLTMMATTKQYFKFVMRMGCGFPSVTLLGERTDWEEILRRVGRLGMYGAEAAEWGALLTIVVHHILECFDHPEAQGSKDFWMRAVQQAGRFGSRTIKTLSGWLTTFCFWDEQGKRIYDMGTPKTFRNMQGRLQKDQVPLVLGGVRFPLISPTVPASTARVNMLCFDQERQVKMKTELIAGHVGATVVGAGSDTLQPRSGWWMLNVGEEPM
ncbi:hypothetical protein MIND_00829800 [Mycena indigotica]|uniref:Uncharacterized protein n=1 Tax=Mycena indigotica TaxID=2126181 RepID=A0A8H6SH69_9AGAR|nr:uncharacterized protein MIND_00829800 [Mycena indigotica]KAF7298822.1 hypothetical protein MIND_00829800 [Mycena indigotica]